jgi:ferredoxin, 2Fe-2S
MHEVRVEPAGFTFSVRDDETVLDAAARQHIWWPQVCNAQARCRSCWVHVDAGKEHGGPMEESEDLALSNAAWRAEALAGEVRLACRLKIHGDIVITKRGVSAPIGTHSGG